jgi:hypothetical protein
MCGLGGYTPHAALFAIARIETEGIGLPQIQACAGERRAAIGAEDLNRYVERCADRVFSHVRAHPVRVEIERALAGVSGDHAARGLRENVAMREGRQAPGHSDERKTPRENGSADIADDRSGPAFVCQVGLCSRCPIQACGASASQSVAQWTAPRIDRARTDAERFSVPFFFSPAYSADLRAAADDNRRGVPRALSCDQLGSVLARKRTAGDYANLGEEVQISHYPAQGK